jgi:hypothetical protein
VKLVLDAGGIIGAGVEPVREGREVPVPEREAERELPPIDEHELEIAGEFVIGAQGAATVGQTGNKVGGATGWTQGIVTRTCVNTGVSASNIVLLCQDFVENTVQIVNSGDSGSPVFRINAGDSVTLLGNLWGGNSSGTLFVYSPIANIERELGALTTF